MTDCRRHATRMFHLDLGLCRGLICSLMTTGCLVAMLSLPLATDAKSISSPENLIPTRPLSRVESTTLAVGGAPQKKGQPTDPQQQHPEMAATTAVSLMDPTKALLLNQEIVCQSIAILNSVDAFQQLGNCTVIEGHLKIYLIDNPTKPYDTLHFPNLREVTDYVLIFRVTGLKTLRNIFPNLAVIRGKTLMRNNALVIFENHEMEEIGLIGLVKIVRGAVYIWRNSRLCYVDTVDWQKLTDKDFHLDNSIRENKPEDQCANQCPPGLCHQFFYQQTRQMCWTAQDCQQVRQPKCTNSHPKPGSCCHDFCLAGCFNSSRNGCLVCQEVHNDGACHHKPVGIKAKACPFGTFELYGRRCISEAFCRAYKKSATVAWKAHDGMCVPECPAYFTPDAVDPHKCVACSGPCPKVCPSAFIDSVASAEAMSHCTIIDGSLEIQIGKGDQFVDALEKSLENLEEVKHYVKVVRSHALLSLRFLKRLRLIRGTELPPGLYALNIIDNQNLQHLFDFTTERQSLTIGNASGKIGFHFNPQLCRSTIDVFVRHINPLKPAEDYDDRDISRTSNGDRAACDMTILKLHVSSTLASAATLNWERFNPSDQRALLGYVIMYRESPTRNLSKFDGRDACGATAWSQVDVSPNTEHNEMFHMLYNLHPARQYGAYVKTYTVASEKRGAQSDIVYFSTMSRTPSKPSALRTESLNESAIRVYWKPPIEPNGVVAYYVVRWVEIKTGRRRLAIRNYCDNPVQMSRQYYVNNLPTTTAVPMDGCPCNGTDPSAKQVVPPDILAAQKAYEEAIFMENTIQDMSFSRRVRDRRSLLEDDFTATAFLDLSSGSRRNSSTVSPTAPRLANRTDSIGTSKTGKVETSTTPMPVPQIINQQKIRDATSFVIPKLHHFTEYSISVEACQENPPGVMHEPCSGEASATTTQTLAKRGADDIPNGSVNVTFTKPPPDSIVEPFVAVAWSDPGAPNGVIVTVDIEFTNEDRDQAKPKTECVPRTLEVHRVPRHAVPFVNMHAGNYSFRLRANSFAGNGSWTEPRYLFVEETLMSPGTGVSRSVLAGIICGVAFPFILLIALGCWFYKPWIKKIPQDPLIVSVNPDYYSYKPDEWEVPRENIKLEQELGTGSFGKVFLGIGTNIEPGKETSRVAVKTVNEDKSMSERSFFLQEASIMKAFRCHHVVKLIGVVSEGQPALVIMELMERGDLKTYLRDQRPDEEHPDRIPPTLSRIYQMAGEICDGMAYIHSRKYVHRDLAARNCMINEQFTVKIGDFGMTRDVYETDYYRKGGKGLLPVRWMAPESLRDGLFTNESDVWSFGVVLWEIVTLAEQPYRGMSNEDVLKFVIAGKSFDHEGKEVPGYMLMPDGCNVALYRLMERCWRFDGRQRPTFMQLVEELYPVLSDAFHEKSYFATVDLTDTPPPGGNPTSETQFTAGGSPGSAGSGGQEIQQAVDGLSRVVSLLRAQPGEPGGTSSDEDDTAATHETDKLLNPLSAEDTESTAYTSSRPSTARSPPVPAQTPAVNGGVPLEARIIIQQNGGSPPSSADNSRSMAMAFGHKNSNGSLTVNGARGEDKQPPRTLV